MCNIRVPVCTLTCTRPAETHHIELTGSQMQASHREFLLEPQHDPHLWRQRVNVSDGYKYIQSLFQKSKPHFMWHHSSFLNVLLGKSSKVWIKATRIVFLGTWRCSPFIQKTSSWPRPAWLQEHYSRKDRRWRDICLYTSRLSDDDLMITTWSPHDHHMITTWWPHDDHMWNLWVSL